MDKASQVRWVCNALYKQYGSSRLGNPKNVLDDLVFIILSNKTSAKTSKKVYKKLKATYSTWLKLVQSDSRQLRRLIKEAGLSTKKSKQIKASLRAIYRDFGKKYNQQLMKMSNEELENYLESLSGVSTKVAKCVMLFTLGREVLPVDVHVHRITKRLGWIKQKRADQSHTILEDLVPPSMRYSFHVDCIMHGRTLCKPQNPLCSRCPINRFCEFNKRHIQ